MKKHLMTSLVFIVLAIGIYFVIEILNSNPPKPIVTVEESEVEVLQGSYCWKGLIKAQCVDMISPPEMIKHHELKPVVVSPQAKLKIEFNHEPIENSLGVDRWISNEEIENVPLSDGVLLVPKEKGIYTYSAYAYWEKGSSSYAFVIEVK